MKIEYDEQADALYLHFRRIQPVDSRDLYEGVTLDLDGKGRIVGIEILDASERVGVESLLRVSIYRRPLKKLAS